MDVRTVNITREELDSLLEIAREIAETAHRGQTRWNGEPYLNHPIRIADKLPTRQRKIVALLHDTVEDSNGEVTLQKLSYRGMPSFIVEAVESLTRKPDESYLDYILRAAGNRLGLHVKLADLQDNMEDAPPHEFSQKHKNLLEKYKLAYYILERKMWECQNFWINAGDDWEQRIQCMIDNHDYPQLDTLLNAVNPILMKREVIVKLVQMTRKVADYLEACLDFIEHVENIQCCGNFPRKIFPGYREKGTIVDESGLVLYRSAEPGAIGYLPEEVLKEICARWNAVS